MNFIDIHVLNDYASRKLLKKSIHPLFNLYIWNYTDLAQFSNDSWDDITLNCRALVTDNLGNIIARAFPKFFNLEQKMMDGEFTIQYDSFRVFDKADGSLGLLFYYHQANQWIFASRGSFESVQSIKGFELLMKNHGSVLDQLDTSRSYIFEIIYPENKIVVDYHNSETLIYLGSFDVYGKEYLLFDEMKQLGFNIIQEYKFDHDDLLKLKELDFTNKEGFVVLFNTGERIKIKFNNYILLHGLNSRLTVKNIFTLLKKNKNNINLEFLKDIPDEYHEWVKNIQQKFTCQYQEIEDKHVGIYFQLKYICEHTSTDNKDHKKLYSSSINEYNYKGITKAILYKMYNNQSYFELICKLINIDGLGKDKSLGMKYTCPEYIPKIIFTIGVSGSGKSTWAKNFQLIHPTCVIISRDIIRGMTSNEKTVGSFQNTLVSKAFSEKCTVIIDNTNLDKNYISSILEYCPNNTIVSYKIFDESEDVCLERIQRRVENGGLDVPALVLRRQLEQFYKIKKSLDSLVKKINIPLLIQDKTLPECVIFDIDGTLAQNISRNPFDMSRVNEDILDESIYDIYNKLKNYTIILCSGRTEDSRNQTSNWLDTHDIKYHKLYLRMTNDTRRDYIIKEEFWREISKKFYIKYLFDDRNQVVNHARRLGLKVLQVQDGDF